MADYYSILKKTITGLPTNNQDSREAVYTKARTAIEARLNAMDPKPSEEAHARQMQLLEDAIVKLGGEFDIKLEPALEAVLPDVAVEKASPDLAVPESVVPPVEAIVAPTINAADTPQVADPKGMDYSETILASTPETPTIKAPKPAKKQKSGCLSSLLPIILALGVIGGGSYALWLNKDALMKGVSDWGSKPSVNKTAPKPVTPKPAKTTDDKSLAPAPKVRVVGEDTTPKSSSQLTAEGVTVEPVLVEPAEPVTPIAVEPEPTPVPTPELPPVIDDGLPPIVEPEPIVQPVSPTPAAEPEVATAQPEATTEPAQTEPQAVTPTTSTAPAVAQKAYLYEEGPSGGDASRDNAAIIWSMSRDIDGESVINGKLDVPGRSMTMNIAIKRNTDASLPASHIIELAFQLPSDFSGGNINNVARFVMKSSEQARGEGLVAVPAKISDGNFLMALNNLDQAVATNRKLLLESSWIDVPLGYTTGRRALVTLEKGAIGTKIFRDAFADWDAR